MAQVTSAEAAKILKKLNEALSSVISKEEQSKDFLAALGEDPESVRPDYDYAATSRKIEELESRIRALKHAINLFNTATVVPKTDMTVDQVLIRIPQLTKKCEKLWQMMNTLPKVRENASGYGHNSAIIDYRYTNYDIGQVEKDYYACKSELDCAQLQLDLVNSTLPITIDDSVIEF